MKYDSYRPRVAGIADPRHAHRSSFILYGGAKIPWTSNRRAIAAERNSIWRATDTTRPLDS